MPRCWLKATTIALTIASTAVGKPSALESQVISDADAPPSLGLNSYAGQVASIMRRELFDLADQEARAPQLEQQVLRASLNVRRLAIELLEQGERVGAEGSLGVVTGLRLFHGRGELDHALNGLMPLSRGLRTGSAPSELADRFNSAVVELRRFNERALVIPAELPVNDPVALDSFVASLMSGLIPAVELTSLDLVVNHWITSQATTPTPAMIAAGLDRRAESSSSQAETLDQLGGRLNTTMPIRADTREQFTAIIATLQRGEAFAELRPSIEAYRALLSKTVDFAEAFGNAEWLDKGTRNVFAHQLHHALVLFQDKQTRELSEQRLEHLVALRTTLVRTSILAQDRVDVRPIDAALAALIQPVEEPDSNPALAFPKSILAAIERMIAYRELKVPKLQGELRIVRRRLDDRYRDAERALFKQLQTVADNLDAQTDPSLTSLFADHQQYLEDLGRIEQLPIWIDQLSLIAPRSAGSVKVHVEKLSRWLLDPTRRPDGVRALDRLQQQLRLFYPLPFERRMRRADREVITATGARHEQLLQIIETRRREWVESLIDREDGQATERMRLLHRLTQTLADVVELLRLTGDAPTLDRWAAWELPTNAIRKTVADLPARLKLATTAAIDENDRSLRVQLERIDRDAPLGKLAGRLGQILAEALDELPDGALAVIGQSANPPTDDAWMRLSRREFASLCRYTLEQQHAESTGQDSLADTLSVYVNTLAERLLADLGEPQSTRLGDTESGQR